MFKGLFKKKSGNTVDVVIKNPGRQKILVINVVRNVTGLGLDDAVHLIAKAPAVVKSGVSLEEAENIKSKLEALGATVVFK